MLNILALIFIYHGVFKKFKVILNSTYITYIEYI